MLKFIGDGILAMFPTGLRTSPCERALDAAESALRHVDERNERRRVERPALVTGLHLALHVGEVLYGNIGCASGSTSRWSARR